MRDDPGGTAAALRAHASLESALAGLTRPGQRITHQGTALARWENEGGPATSEAAASGASERRAWAAHEVRQARVADAVRAYTLVLREGGVPLAATLIAVASVVRGHVGACLSPDAGGAVQRDAARSCLEAFFGA